MHETTLNRRQWIAASGALAAAAWSAPKLAMAAEPIANRTSPHFKLSLAAYSYRKLLQGNKPELTLADFINDCAKMQLDGTELTSYYFPPNVTTEQLLALKHQAFLLGLSVSGTAVGNDFGHPAGEEREKQIAGVKTWIDNAAVLTAPVIRIFAGHDKKGVAADESHRLMVEGMQEVCDYAGTKGVFLALENHGGPTSTAEGLLKLVKDVDSPWFGVNLDTGNFHSDDIYGELAQVAPYALNVQVKVVVSGPDKKKVPTDFARIAKILRDANYRGFVVLEYEEEADPREECPKYIETLREALA
ncbi:sugar phosphate isomerase/epimerase [Blastopirellula sp. JC732]|uniref:Sugar phosphate isomerase/epimerase n=1 Tax=Blastopirellula sediminis TaxID=2894196 RepID=A0A9X1MK90_9BACT|nr:sugar phosphate isomerase/epimerase family protein [Blastopirellula sediminis]MCC9609458.1 sugar phosphate isomerase/epimerase [Blastopirellula sediminis]MCC9627765.1 sugar phosphate isomerase/epimerase [Blastopirellula sediminis]